MGPAAWAQEQVASGFLHEFKLGALAHDVPDLWSGFQLEEDSVDVNVEFILSPSLDLWLGSLRPALGASVNMNGATSKGYFDVRWEIGRAAGPFLATGLGAAVHDGNLTAEDPDRKALGSRVLFHIPAELGWRFDNSASVSVYFDHMSNADLADANEGMDTLGLRFGYRLQ
jgi:hypothetical protein